VVCSGYETITTQITFVILSMGSNYATMKECCKLRECSSHITVKVRLWLDEQRDFYISDGTSLLIHMYHVVRYCMALVIKMARAWFGGGILLLLSLAEQVTFILSKDNYLILQSLFCNFLSTTDFKFYS